MTKYVQFNFYELRSNTLNNSLRFQLDNNVSLQHWHFCLRVTHMLFFLSSLSVSDGCSLLSIDIQTTVCLSFCSLSLSLLSLHRLIPTHEINHRISLFFFLFCSLSRSVVIFHAVSLSIATHCLRQLTICRVF
jgi:hypothetical protein